MVEQLGLAIMFVSLYLDISSGLTSGTTKGMLSTYLNSDVLSITMQSSLAALVAYSFEIDPPALKKAMSIFVKLILKGFLRFQYAYKFTTKQNRQ